jgi:hypothetical protein
MTRTDTKPPSTTTDTQILIPRGSGSGSGFAFDPQRWELPSTSQFPSGSRSRKRRSGPKFLPRCHPPRHPSATFSSTSAAANPSGTCLLSRHLLLFIKQNKHFGINSTLNAIQTHHLHKHVYPNHSTSNNYRPCPLRHDKAYYTIPHLPITLR